MLSIDARIGGLPYLDLPGLAAASNASHDAFSLYFGQAPGRGACEANTEPAEGKKHGLRGAAAAAWISVVAGGPLAWWPVSTVDDFAGWIRDNAGLFTAPPATDAAGYCNAATLDLCSVVNAGGALRSLEVDIQEQMDKAGASCCLRTLDMA